MRTSSACLVAATQLIVLLQCPCVYHHMPFTLQSITTNLFVLVLPGLWLTTLMGRWQSFPAVVVSFLWASLGMVGGAAFGRFLAAVLGIAHAPFDDVSFWIVCGAVIEILFVAALIRKRRPTWLMGSGCDRRAVGGVLVLGLIAYALVSWGATRVVPPQQDQDMVLVCPTAGLYHYLTPYGLESRYPYQFNKPPALYFLTGASLILRGELGLAQPFCTSAMKTIPSKSLSRRELRKYRKTVIDTARNRDIERFFATPALTTSVRIPATALAVLLACSIYLFVLSRGAPRWFCFLLAMAVITLPDVFIRLSYAGFTTISLLLMLMMCWLYLDARGQAANHSRSLFFCSALLALTNHKALLVVPAYVLADLVANDWTGTLRTALSAWTRRVTRTGIVTGALIGTAAYWIYGLSIDPQVFIDDHIFYDFLDRFAGRTDTTYPGIIELWYQWLRNLSFVMLPMGLLAMFMLAANAWRKFSLFVFWFVIGGTLASLVDWKQTKHLMLVLLPVVLAPGLAWSLMRRHLRWVCMLLLCVALLLSLSTIYRLSVDFSFLPPSKVW